MAILLLAEHDNATLSDLTGKTLTAATQSPPTSNYLPTIVGSSMVTTSSASTGFRGPLCSAQLMCLMTCLQSPSRTSKS